MGKRTEIGYFIHKSWTNMNLRAGKYKYLTSTPKNKCYSNVNVNITREEYKQLCIKNKDLILSLKRPSVDRIDSFKDYTLNNIRFIELSDNIKLKKHGNRFSNATHKRGVRKIGNKYYSRIRINRKEINLGSFNNEEEAYEAFENYYFQHYKKQPW